MDTTAGAGSPVVATADVGAALRDRWWLLVICALLGLAAAAVVIQVMPHTYAATTTVHVTPTGEEQAASNAATANNRIVNMDTEAKIVTSAAVAERVKDQLQTATPTTTLVEQVTVAVEPNTTILAITAETATADDAQRLSREFAKAYLAQREESARVSIAGQVKIYEARLAEVTKELQAVTGQIASLPANSPDRAYADARQRILVEQVTNISGQLSTLQAITVSPGRVLSDAPRPTDPEQPPPILLLAAGLIVGLLAGLGLATLLAKIDRRIRRPADLQALGDVPLLGTVPPGRASGGVPLPGVAPTASPIGQAFGQIRNDVTTALPSRPATLLVAGTEPGQASSMVAANVAVSLARSGTPVLLVCADFAGSTVERMLGLESLSRADGLAEALGGQAEPLSLLRAAPVVPGLWVLGTGRSRDTAAELLQSRQLEWVLSTVRGESFVILEAPPTSAGADAQAMARLCDAAILVAEVGRSRLDEIDDGAHQLARVGTPLLGVVLTHGQATAGRNRQKAPVVTEGASLGETTVAIRTDQLRALRARITGEGKDAPLPDGAGRDAHATAGAASRDRPDGEGPIGGLPASGVAAIAAYSPHQSAEAADDDTHEPVVRYDAGGVPATVRYYDVNGEPVYYEADAEPDDQSCGGGPVHPVDAAERHVSETDVSSRR